MLEGVVHETYGGSAAPDLARNIEGPFTYRKLQKMEGKTVHETLGVRAPARKAGGPLNNTKHEGVLHEIIGGPR